MAPPRSDAPVASPLIEDGALPVPSPQAELALRPLARADIAQVRAWPAYPPAFAGLDYALRHGGWLDEYYSRPATWCYLAALGRRPVGFTLLATTAPSDAEFRVALHPEHLGRGLGGALTDLTLERGFGEHRLERVHLLVRPDHTRAHRLYARHGFIDCGVTCSTVGDRSLEFIVMERFNHKGEGA